MSRRRNSAADEARTAERLERALASAAAVTSDEEINDLVAVTQALAPAVHPREAWRATVMDRALREFAGKPAGGARPRASLRIAGEHVPEVHAADVVDTSLGRVLLADVEALDSQRVQAVLREIGAHVVAPLGHEQ